MIIASNELECFGFDSEENFTLDLDDTLFETWEVTIIRWVAVTVDQKLDTRHSLRTWNMARIKLNAFCFGEFFTSARKQLTDTTDKLMNIH